MSRVSSNETGQSSVNSLLVVGTAAWLALTACSGGGSEAPATTTNAPTSATTSAPLHTEVLRTGPLVDEANGFADDLNAGKVVRDVTIVEHGILPVDAASVGVLGLQGIIWPLKLGPGAFAFFDDEVGTGQLRAHVVLTGAAIQPEPPSVPEKSASPAVTGSPAEHPDNLVKACDTYPIDATDGSGPTGQRGQFCTAVIGDQSGQHLDSTLQYAAAGAYRGK